MGEERYNEFVRAGSPFGQRVQAGRLPSRRVDHDEHRLVDMPALSALKLVVHLAKIMKKREHAQTRSPPRRDHRAFGECRETCFGRRQVEQCFEDGRDVMTVILKRKPPSRYVAWLLFAHMAPVPVGPCGEELMHGQHPNVSALTWTGRPLQSHAEAAALFRQWPMSSRTTARAFPSRCRRQRLRHIDRPTGIPWSSILIS